MKKIIHQVKDLDCTASLIQTSKNRFKVSYGLQVKTGLSYREAAAEYGECIMHSATCAGLIVTRD